ncbi:hypothetical protein [Streptomyces sp. NPDC046988]|uniref:hypothetical protein n=1 Tax=Streptomyces sp. NPDC046988 TaxID=3154922 RepID=UPI0033FA3FB7
MPAQAAAPVPHRLAAACQEWDTDNYTFGVRCATSQAYYAKVTCTNGSSRKTARGVITSSNIWSYAYCSAFGPGYYKVGGSGGVVYA